MVLRDRAHRGRRTTSAFLRGSLASIFVALVLVAPAQALGAAHCDGRIAEWASRCIADERVPLDFDCPDGRLIFRAAPAEPATPVAAVEVQRGEAGFRRIGAFAVSPIGQFDDFREAPAHLRRAFAAVVDCVERRGDSLGLGQPEPPKADATPPSAAWPWRLIVGVLAAAALASRELIRSTSGPRRPRALVTSAGLAALTGATYAWRRLVFPLAFRHQNGQGPVWVSSAITGAETQYGPGYAELFGFVRGSSEPDLTIMRVDAVAGALIPATAWLLSRRVGASRLLATAVALVLALDPTLARIAQSESYYACGSVLAFLAAVALLEGARGGRVASAWFALGVASAGFLVAQLARVHPVMWLASALVPLPMLAMRGSASRRRRLAVVGCLGVGASVTVLSGATMVAVVRGPMAKWLHQGETLFVPLSTYAYAWAPLGVIAVALAMRRRWSRSFDRVARNRLRELVWVAAAVASAIALGHASRGAQRPWFHATYAALTLAPVLAVGVGAAVRLLPPRVAALAWVAAGSLGSAARWSHATEIATDAREAEFVMSWRARLPPGATLLALESADTRTSFLPVYSASDSNGARVEALGPDDATRPIVSRGNVGDWFWYRSSVCAMPSGASICAAFESSHRLVPVERTDLPAIESDLRGGYAVPRIDVGLYRIAE